MVGSCSNFLSYRSHKIFLNIRNCFYCLNRHMLGLHIVMSQHCQGFLRFTVMLGLPLIILSGCLPVANDAHSQAVAPHLEWLAFRVRSDATVALNADAGWASPENSAADIQYDQPFRFRVQVRATIAPPEGHVLGLQYRRNGETWLPLGFAKFPYPDFATPVMSVISTDAYAQGEQTERLLGAADLAWDDGAGINAVASTPVWRTTQDALEWEWPLVVRRFSDGPTFADDGDVFELRVVDGQGRALAGQQSAALRLTAAPGHLGGTFIETPTRIGPYQSAAGHLYFFMEPSETDNWFMAVKSTDAGVSWRETDGVNRPVTGDLEGVASVQTGSVIHFVHQISRDVFYHAFQMDDETSANGKWLVTDQSLATPDEPPTQFADLVARSDGSLVTLYGGAQRLFMQSRSAQGAWGAPQEIDSDVPPELSGPVMAIAADDTITMAYTGRDGSGFVRHLRADGTLSARQLFSANLGTSDDENGAIVPLVVLAESGETVLMYREHTGLLFERRFSRDGQLSEPEQVAQIPVITSAVDSEQVGADLIVHDSKLHLLFIDAQTRSIFYTRSSQKGNWSAPQVVVEGIQAAWVRGSVHRDGAGNPVYGFVLDAGSTGGSGFNRYVALPL